MTSINKFALALGMIISFLSLSVYAQEAMPLKKFSTAGISFDYPDGYSVTDESTEEAQQFVIKRGGRSVQLTIVVMRGLVQRNEMPAAIDNFKEPLIKKTGLALGHANSPGGTPIKTRLGTKHADGVRLRSLGARKRTADVVWLRWSFRLVGLSFIRPAADETVEAQLWETVRSSLQIEPPVVGAIKPDGPPPTGKTFEGGVLNGKAIALPKPDYPPLARAARAAGTVVVQVLIDEEGNVLSARAISGHPLLQAAAVTAARGAKFSPTLLDGEPVKVTGVMQYNFVPQ